ncbi:MAG: caspase family protein [Acidobacteriota bacterium]
MTARAGPIIMVRLIQSRRGLLHDRQRSLLSVAVFLAVFCPAPASNETTHLPGLVINRRLGTVAPGLDLYLGRVGRSEGRWILSFYFLNRAASSCTLKLDNVTADHQMPVQVDGITRGPLHTIQADATETFSVTAPLEASVLHLTGVGLLSVNFEVDLLPLRSLLGGGAEREAASGAPSITLVSPPIAPASPDGPTSAAEVEGYLFTVRGQAVSPEGIARVLVNGQPASLDDHGFFLRTIRLKVGDNQVEVLAEDARGRTSRRAFTLSRREDAGGKTPASVESIRPGAEARPDAVAVIMGNRDYGAGVPAAEFALSDALTMREFVITAMGYRPGNVIHVENAHKADMEAIFGTAAEYRGRLFSAVRPGVSDVFVYYSGHGAPDLETRKAFLVPVDADPARLRLTGYSLETLYTNLSQLPARHLTVVLESCFSGRVDGGSLLDGVSPVRLSLERPEALLSQGTLFTSSRGEEVSHWYPATHHSLFTYFFLRGALGSADANGDDALTPEEIQAYVSQQVPYTARRLYGRDQNPRLTGSQARILVRYPGSPKTPRARGGPS